MPRGGLKMETINLEEASDMQRLATAQVQISSLKREMKRWEEEEKKLLSGILKKVTFTEDRFLTTIGKSGDSFREGDFKLLRQPKVTRSIITTEFLATFPDIGAKIATIPVGKAELLVGKANLEAYCEHKTTYQYLVVDMRIP
jgi:hypothetical protein